MMCYDDLAILPIVREYWLARYNRLARYPSFMRLAILFEKRGEYSRAIEVCQMAIKEGFSEDVYGRIERLINKRAKEIETDLL